MLCNNTITGRDNCFDYSIDYDAQTITAGGSVWGEPVECTETFSQVLQGFPFNFCATDAEWIAEWYPELIDAAAQKCRFHPYDWLTFDVMTEDAFAEYLRYFDVSEDEYNYSYGFTIRDAGLSGVLVVGE